MSALDDVYDVFSVSPKPQLTCANCGKEVVILATTVVPCACLFEELRVENERLKSRLSAMYENHPTPLDDGWSACWEDAIKRVIDDYFKDNANEQ